MGLTRSHLEITCKGKYAVDKLLTFKTKHNEKTNKKSRSSGWIF